MKNKFYLAVLALAVIVSACSQTNDESTQSQNNEKQQPALQSSIVLRTSQRIVRCGYGSKGVMEVLLTNGQILYSEDARSYILEPGDTIYYCGEDIHKVMLHR